MNISEPIVQKDRNQITMFRTIKKREGRERDRSKREKDGGKVDE